MADIFGPCPIVGTEEGDWIFGFGSGSIDGLGGADDIAADTSDNLIRGGEGDDTISGGVGDDTLFGGSGNDHFRLPSDPLNSIVIRGGEGFDTIEVTQAALNLGLEVMASIERLRFDGDNTQFVARESQIFDRAGNMKLAVSGDADLGGLNILIVGVQDGSLNASKIMISNWDSWDMLIFWGDDGSDRITGSVYTDLITGYGGNDVLRGGDGADSLQGREDNDVLYGGEGDDTLDGGVGVDIMIGGGGADHYRVDDASDRVGEKSDAGDDIVESSISYALTKNVETLLLLDGDIDGTGNRADNVLVGGSGANALNGGAGSDTLTGGEGRDTFVFDTRLRASGADTITDFTVGEDRIALSSAVFGEISEASFVVGDAAADADDRIIYNEATGGLFLDRDGTGTAYGMIQFASLTPGTTLTAGDFVFG